MHFRFIKKFGTHVVVGVKMGGKDIVYVKQQHSSPLQPADVQKRLKEVADKRFSDGAGQYSNDSRKLYENEMVCHCLSYCAYMCLLILKLKRADMLGIILAP